MTFDSTDLVVPAANPPSLLPSLSLSQWDNLSRRWKLTVRKAVTEIGLLIADELQLIGGAVGPAYEVLISRTRFVSSQTGNPTRIVACSVSLANARDLGDWLGASAQNVFNFAPSTRPLPMDIHIQSYDVPHFPSLMLGMAKPAYLAINDWAGKKPVIAFVPSRKQCKLTANDILTYCLANQEGKRFLNIEQDDLQPHLDRIQDGALKETLAYGIGFYHEALSKQDKRTVERLFESGAIQVLVASKDTAWGLPVTAYMVIIMGVQYFDGKDHRYADYPVADLLQMMGRACRPTKDTNSRCVLMLQQTRKEFYKKFLSEALPIESQLPSMLHDHFNAEIVAKTIENKQEAVDWCTWTWFYRRMSQNPVYYNLQGTSHRHLSDHLSELVEETLNALVASKCITIEDEMDTSPLNLGMIAAYYYISNVTVEIFSMSLSERTKLKGLLEIVSSSSEFEDVPIRHHEDILLKRIYDRSPVKLESQDYESPHFKTFILLQAHFSRMVLPADLASDQAVILGKVIGLLSACVDVMSSNAYMSALGAMDLSQMCVQAMWETDSPLKQIPHFSSEIISRCKAAEVTSVYDITELEDEQRNDLLRLDTRQMRDVAQFVNAYPSIEVTYTIDEADEGGYTANKPLTLRVTLDRDADADEEDSNEVVAPYYPNKKTPAFWLVVGSGKSLSAIKKGQSSLLFPASLSFYFLRPLILFFFHFDLCSHVDDGAQGQARGLAPGGRAQAAAAARLGLVPRRRPVVRPGPDHRRRGRGLIRGGGLGRGDGVDERRGRGTGFRGFTIYHYYFHIPSVYLISSASCEGTGAEQAERRVYRHLGKARRCTI